MQRTYLAIDLKSYYASAECAARHLDPLTTNLVVADSSRTEKTICLAVSPSLKAYGIPGRARLFEVVQKVKEVNANRLREAVRLRKAVYKDGRPFFSSASYDSLSIAADPSLELSYLVAPPRMAYYEKVSRQIYGIYLKYIAPEDIVVYSIDEVFIDATSYLSHYNMTAHDLAMTMIREVLYTTGITATAGIGTNLYLAKLAMDITAKHAAPDKDGVRIAELELGNIYTADQILETLHTMQRTLLNTVSGYIPSYTRTRLTDALHKIFDFRADATKRKMATAPIFAGFVAILLPYHCQRWDFKIFQTKKSTFLHLTNQIP